MKIRVFSEGSNDFLMSQYKILTFQNKSVDLEVKPTPDFLSKIFERINLPAGNNSLDKRRVTFTVTIVCIVRQYITQIKIRQRNYIVCLE